MVKLEEISSTSTFAWSHDSLPLLVTGTVAGAVNASFDSTSTFEIRDPFSKEENKSVVSGTVENRFHSLAWSKPFEGRSRGVIAGAFENGIVEFWDADELIRTKDLEKASVHKSSKHNGPVRTLLFNPIQSHVLVSGGSKGELFVWDVKKFSEPFSPGHAMTPMDEISSVAWNNSVAHIFASTSNGGYTSIWDLKSKREVLHLSYNNNSSKANFSCVAWHPSQSTKLATASDSDGCPLILTWDLRNANEPEKVLLGHGKGILSIDWCKLDPELLLSSGKDNSTILWNPVKGEKLGEYPTTANWAFHTEFAPAAPDVFSTASFDGKIVIQTLQDTSPPVVTKTSANDDEFWNEISTTDTQQPSFSIKQAPVWLKNPSAVSFGFGSKLVSIKTNSNNHSVVSIEKISSNKSLSNSVEKLSQAFGESDFKEILESKANENSVNPADKSDWQLLKKISDLGKKGVVEKALNLSEPEGDKTSTDSGKEDSKQNDAAADDSFFDQLGLKDQNGFSKSSLFVPQGQFNIYGSKASDEDKQLINLILRNKTEDAVHNCLEQGKLLEAFVLALDASEEIKEKVKSHYFEKNSDNKISRVLYSASSKDVTDIVAHANVSDWREIALSINSFCDDENEFNSKMIELGDRILNSGQATKEKRDNAILCYLAGNGLGKIAAIWLKELPKYESALLESKDKSITSPSDARYESLKNFVLKIAIHRSIVPTKGGLEGPSVESIANAIFEFTNLIAGNGQFDLAEKFLELLPSDLHGLKTEKERIFKASGKDVEKQQTTTRTKATTQRSSANANYERVAPTVNSYTAGLSNNATPLGGPSTPSHPIPPMNNPRIPAVTPSASNIYAKPAPNPYAQAPQGNPYINSYLGFSQQAASANTLTPPPAGPPKAAYKQETEGWNDLPETFKAKSNQRRVAAASTSQSPTPLPPAPAPAPVPKKPSVTAYNAPPPPKGASRSNSKSTVPTQLTSVSNSPRQPQAQVNTRYAPPISSNAAATSNVPPPANTSPYLSGLGVLTAPVVTAPPPPPKNPYAPTGSTGSPVPSKNPYAPPVPTAPTQNAPPASFGNNVNSPKVSKAPTAPPKNPYAPTTNPSSPSPAVNAGGIPKPRMGGVIPPPPMASTTHAPSLVSPPPVQPGFVKGPATTNAPPPQPEKVKYPAGDRSHIPESASPIFKILTAVLEDVKPKVPERYAAHVIDIEKRINILFDHLNNKELLSDSTVEELKGVCNALESKDYGNAAALNIQIATNHSEEIGNWQVGVKRLIQMAEAL